MAFASVWIFVIAALKSDHLGDSSVFREFLTSLKWVFVLGQPKLFGFENTGQIVANVTWSLRYEWEFYLSLPLLGIVFYNIAKRLGRKFTLSVFLLLSYGLLYFYPDFARKAATFAPLFLTGMLAAELRKSSIVKEKLTSFGAAIVGAGALAVQVFLFHGAFGLPQIILLGLFFIPVVCGNDYFGILSRRVSIYLGEISYSIYLMHGIILFVIFQMSPAPSWVIENNLGLASLFPLAAVLSVLIPTLTHKYVEIPGIRLGRSCNENRSSLWREIVAQQK
jgi:peptidoglycan/LPS O-acetylase OafA/YrhL